MKCIIYALRRNEHGGTAIEYGLIAALVVLGAFAAMQNFGGTTIRMWNNVSNAVQKA